MTVHTLAFVLLLSSTASQTQPSQVPSGITAPASIGTPHACPDYYPADALRAGEEGTTTLGFTIAPDGSVKDMSVVQSSGFENLDAAAMACAAQWRYRPAMQNGFPVEVSWQANVRWAMDPSDRALRYIFAVAMACTINPPASGNDLKTVSGPTVVDLELAPGAITDVRIQSSSGNAKLDQRAVACFRSVSPELAKGITTVERFPLPVDWRTLVSAPQ
jgi:TonB family protein